jgi:hypothetical protein
MSDMDSLHHRPVQHQLRRATAGTWHPHPMREQFPGERFWKNVANTLPISLPAGARIVEHWQTNWDGGPGLVTRIAVTDHPLPEDWPLQTIAMAEDAIAAARSRLLGFTADWEASSTVSTCTWFEGTLDRAERVNANLQDDALAHIREIITEMASGIPNLAGQAGTMAIAKLWRKLADLGESFPDEIEDPHHAFGHAGPPTVPPPWRGRQISAISSPWEPFAALEPLGIEVLALGRDEATLRMAVSV